MLTRRDNLLIRPWQERRYINHRNKWQHIQHQQPQTWMGNITKHNFLTKQVESALPAIDVRPPAQRQHVACKLKKLQKEAERCQRIHQDNFTLLQHLSSIMKSNRLDNYWVEAPPNFLHRVGIYHVRCHEEPESQAEDMSGKLHTRKERCLGCNPRLVSNKIVIPEERVPWEAPKKRISRRSSSFMEESETSDFKLSTKKSSNESLSKLNNTPKSSPSVSTDLRFPMVETHSLSLKHGALRLVVNFPPQTTVKLRTGQSERLLQSEFCNCSRTSDKTSSPE